MSHGPGDTYISGCAGRRRGSLLTRRKLIFEVHARRARLQRLIEAEDVLVNGKPAMTKGRYTGNLAGKALRHAISSLPRDIFEAAYGPAKGAATRPEVDPTLTIRP